MEIWKQILGYEGMYEISNYGEVRSMNRIITYSNGVKAKYKGKLRNASCCEYRLMSLSKNRVVKMVKVSRLVATHFLPRITGKDIVNHKDGNKYNDHVNNLEWCTYSENAIHALDKGLNPSRKHKVSGVFYDKNRGKWVSYLYRNSKDIFIGRFNTEAEAISKRQIKLNEYENSKS